MNSFLLDTSALWYLFRTPAVLGAWEGYIGAGAFRVCAPTRTGFLSSATGPAHRDGIADGLDALCPPAGVPKDAWRWVDTAQYKLT